MFKPFPICWHIAGKDVNWNSGVLPASYDLPHVFPYCYAQGPVLQWLLKPFVHLHRASFCGLLRTLPTCFFFGNSTPMGGGKFFLYPLGVFTLRPKSSGGYYLMSRGQINMALSNSRVAVLGSTGRLSMSIPHSLPPTSSCSFYFSNHFYALLNMHQGLQGQIQME